MRLGFHYHIPAIAKKGKIYMPGYQGDFIDSLAAYCDQVVCFLHSPSRTDPLDGDYPIQTGNVKLVDIGPHTSVPHRTIFSSHFARTVTEWKAKLDVLLIRGPSPLLPAIAKSAAPLPVALLLVGDYRVNLDGIPQPAWRKALIRLWAEWNYRQQFQIAKDAFTFVNSHKLHQELQQHLPNLFETRTTTLSLEKFFRRKDTCQSPPYRLLYTGRITRAKGLLELVEAVFLLTQEGYEVILDMVGSPEKGDSVLDEIKSLANEWGIDDRVIYHGYRSFGPELFEFYRQADIYVIPSHFEGFPRTIWEAMASSLPVVATQVGSIPAYTAGAARLVPPKQVDALTKAIQELLTTSELRQKLIVKGVELASHNTLEVRAREMITQIELWLQSGAGKSGK